MCLVALAGFVDALALTSLGGFFASSMGANTTRLGVALGSGTGWAALGAAGLVLSFVSGGIVAAVLRRARGARWAAAAMVVVTALLAAGAGAAAWWPGPLMLLLLAAGMGCMHGVLADALDAASFTGVLTRLAQTLAEALMGDSDRWGWVPLLALWLSFLAGAVMATAGLWRWGTTVLWLAPMAAAGLAVALARVGGVRGPA